MVKVVFVLLFCGLIFAQDALRELHLQTENDADFRTDRDYTYGSEIGALFDYKTNSYFSFVLAHQMFTPNDFDKEDVNLSNERPYAGYMYIGGGLHTVQNNTLNSYNIQIGFVGPSVKMDKVQEIIHSIIGSPKPTGWENQIGDELILQFNYQRKYFQTLPKVYDFFQCLIYNGGFDLGNASSKIEAGMFYSLGNAQREDFGVSRIDYKSYNTIPYGEKSTKTHRYWLNFWLEAIGVGRDIFLDGNSFKSSASVDKNYFVLKGGFGITYNYENWHIEYIRTYSTKEFSSQSYYHSYGSLLIGYNF